MGKGRTITVNTGKVAIGYREDTLCSGPIGSCIVTILYDQSRKTAGMSHAMLPGRAQKEKSPDNRYVFDAIDKLLGMLVADGSRKEDILCCIAGGNNVLMKHNDTICKTNIHSILGYFEKSQIRMVAKSLGGFLREQITFEIKTKKVMIKTENSPERELCIFEDINEDGIAI